MMIPDTSFAVANAPWVGETIQLDAAYQTDEQRMRLAIGLATENVRRESGGPFGAAVFESDTGRLISVGVNSVTRLKCSVLHAEVVAIMLAQARLKSYSLRSLKHELVVSCEPCAMCLGAVLWSGVGRLVFGALREDAERLGFDEGPVFEQSYQYLEQRGLEVVRGVCRAEALEPLRLYKERGGLIYNP
jgi:tRNA(Arg) A34 adenosine deaminase TadA